MSALAEVPHYDILQWQAAREQEILSDYRAGNYTFSHPYVLLDPYEMNPCSALVMFEAAQSGAIQVTVAGDDSHSTFQYSQSSADAHFEIPILGLYAGRANTVTLKDPTGVVSTIIIQTDPLPPDFQTFELVKSAPEQMEPGVTLFTACFDHTYTALLDCNAQVRGYLSNKYMAHGTAMIQLKNGNMLATGDEYKQIPYNMTSLWEFNWLGKVFREYEVPNGVHHSITELPGGDILAASNNADMFASGTREDEAIIIDRNTGAVKKAYDFRKILDETRDPYQHFSPNILHAPNVDWMHMNGVLYNPADNNIIVSSPIQSQVVSIDADTSKVNWIFGPHEGYDGSSAYLQQYLLTPAGTGFEWPWCQHCPILLPDMDNNPDTTDIMLLDNGQSRSFDQKGAVEPSQNYSRAVQYRIDNKTGTAEQIWEYGKERGSDCYATFLGSVQYLGDTGNRLIDFGGQLRVNGTPVDDIVSGVLGAVPVQSRVVEVSAGGDVVYEVSARANSHAASAETYQARRLPLYSADSFNYCLGQAQGQRLGQSYTCGIAQGINPPPLYGGNVQVSFSRICNENGRLVADGTVSYNGKAYLLARAMLVLKSADASYVFAANSGLNGRFFLSVDTANLKKGTYMITVIGAVREGNDALNGPMHTGYVKTPYKITVQ